MNKYLQLSNNGQALHFIHANGYPPECYKTFLGQFKDEFAVTAHLLRPLWDKTNKVNIKSWCDLRQDIRQNFVNFAHPTTRVTFFRTTCPDPRPIRVA